MEELLPLSFLDLLNFHSEVSFIYCFYFDPHILSLTLTHQKKSLKFLMQFLIFLFSYVAIICVTNIKLSKEYSHFT